MFGMSTLAGVHPATIQSMWDIPRTGHPHGLLSSYIFKSRLLKNKREIWVYTPPSYETTGGRYPLLIVLDGQAYTSELIPGPTILDNLIAEKQIPPLVAVFVSSMDQRLRDLELPCYDPFINSLTSELMPWIHDHYHVSQEGAQTVIAGSSYGGLAAAYAALRQPQHFGKVLSQSGAFWWQPKNSTSELWLLKQYENYEKLPVQFYLDVGDQETEAWENGQSMIKVNRAFNTMLLRKGYDVCYQEFPGGHEYEAWRKTFATGLIALFGHVE